MRTNSQVRISLQKYTRASTPSSSVNNDFFCFTQRSKQLDRVKPFLEALRQQGLGISLSVAQFVRETLEITPPVSDLLAELCSGELIPVKLDPRPTPLQWANNAQVIKRKSDFFTFARERKLDEALASKKVPVLLKKFDFNF